MKSIKELREEIRILKQDHIDTYELVRIAGAIEQEIDSDYMRLPRDRNGVPIHVGDEMVYVLPSGKQIRRCVKYVSSNEFAGYETCHKGECELSIYGASSHHHYEPPTVERVLREFADEYDSVSGYAPDENEVLAKFAERLRLRDMEQED